MAVVASKFNPHAIPFLAYFFMACYVQANDPDAKLWVSMYMVPVLLTLWSTFQFGVMFRLRKVLANTVALSALIAAATANNFSTWKTILDDPRKFDSILSNDEVGFSFILENSISPFTINKYRL